jgi:predicted nucleic acid-binding protein
VTHLLDSSAWLIHLFGEPGVEEINQLFEQPQVTVHVSALSLPEVYARLLSLDRGAEWPQVWQAYSALFDKVIPADEAVAHMAVQYRTAAATRLPTIDGLIAATAGVHDLTLVHRDPHMAAIPTDLLRQMQL